MKTVVACVADHKQEVYTALNIIPMAGKLHFLHWIFYPCIKDVKKKQDLEAKGNAAMNTYNRTAVIIKDAENGQQELACC